MIKLGKISLVLLLASISYGRTVTTSFPAPAENPISEAGNWQVPATGQPWGKVQKTTGIVFGVNQPNNFGDPTALFTGAWGANQTITGTVRIVNNGTSIREVELRTRSTISNNFNNGYELLCNVSTGQNYGIQLVRWKGPNGAEHTGFEYIAQYAGIQRCVNGDVVRIRVFGNFANVYLNDMNTPLLMNRNDTGQNQTNVDLNVAGLGVLQTGAPGVGFYREPGGNDSQFANYGWSTITATDETPVANCTQATVEAAIAAATAGDTLALPACTGQTWTAMDIDKAITLKGAGKTQTVITVGNGNIWRKQSTGITRITGIGFTRGTGTEANKGITISYHTGLNWKTSREIIIDNNDFTLTGSAAMFLILPPGGYLFHHNSFNAPWDNSMLQLKDPSDTGNSWTQADTMGTRDSMTTLSGTFTSCSPGSPATYPACGELNGYMEDNTFTGGTNQMIDCDDGCRLVYRFNTGQDTSVNSHGFDTSPFGMRHYEVYNNVFHNTRGNDQLSNANWTVWQRGGVSVIYNNTMDNIAGNNWGDKPELKAQIRVDQIPGKPVANCAAAIYPLPRQLGQNHNGTNFFTDPNYAWANQNGVGFTGGAAIATNGNSTGALFGTGEGWSNPCGLNGPTFYQSGRDFVYANPPSGGTPKPGYTGFTYPHPLQALTGAITPPALAITTTTPLPTATIGVVYDVTMQATGGTTPYTWSTVGTLPTGLGPITSGGRITGTPTVAGTFNFSIRVTDAASTVVTLPVSMTVNPTGAPPLPSGNNGIAAGFPNDTNIGTAPGVLFADNYESYASTAALTASPNYSNIYGSWILDTNPANAFAGNKSLRFAVAAASTEIASAVERTISPKQDKVFIRVYGKFPANYTATGSEHNGPVFAANYCGPGQGTACAAPLTIPGGQIGAGRDNKAFIDQENSCDRAGSSQPCYSNTYIYYPEQRDDFGDHWFPDLFALPNSGDIRDFGASVPKSNFVPNLNQWYSIELMVQMNSAVGIRDGRVATWIDGNLVSDYQGLILRSVQGLQFDRADLQFYIKNNPGVQMLRWYDNLVIATSYIGPMVVTATPTVNLSPASIAFGSIDLGQSSGFQPATLTNTGSGDLTITSIGLTGTGANQFNTNNTCPITPTPLAPSASCTINIQFAPTTGGAKTANLSVVDNASGSPHTIALTGTGTTCTAPKPFPCARTDYNIIPKPTTPNMGNLQGAGTIIIEPDFGERIVRVTDAVTSSGATNVSYVISNGGSLDDTWWNTNSTKFLIQPVAGTVIPMNFDPVTMQATPTYPASNLQRIPAQAAQMSTVDPNRVWGLNDTIWQTWDLSSPTFPVGQTFIDLTNAGPNCLPNGFNITHVGMSAVSDLDAVLPANFSDVGGQNTDPYVVVYVQGKGCMVINTVTGAITGDPGFAGGEGLTCNGSGCTGTLSVPTDQLCANAPNCTNRFSIHNVKINKDGTYLMLAVGQCKPVGSCGNNSSPYLWKIGSNIVTYTCGEANAGTCGGHSTIGQSHYSNRDGSPAYQFNLRPMLSPSGPIVGQVPAPGPTTYLGPMDYHPAWTAGNSSDTFPILLMFAPFQFDATITAPRSVWWQEVVAMDPLGVKLPWRLGRSWTSGVNWNFDSQNAIGAWSQDGRFYSFTSDWMGTLGSTAGASTCTVDATLASGLGCRNDVFIMDLRLNTTPTGLVNQQCRFAAIATAVKGGGKSSVVVCKPPIP